MTYGNADRITRVDRQADTQKCLSNLKLNRRRTLQDMSCPGCLVMLQTTQGPIKVCLSAAFNTSSLSSRNQYILGRRFKPQARHLALNFCFLFIRIMTAILATLAPISTDAIHAVKLPANRQQTRLSAYLPEPMGTFVTHPSIPIVVMDLATMMGQHCLTFGAGKASDVRIPGPDISHQHFVLYVDVESQVLILKDVSDHGTVVCSPETGERTIQQADVPITSTTNVSLGDGNRIRFQLDTAVHSATTDKSLRLAAWKQTLRAAGASKKRSWDANTAEGELPRKRRKLNPTWRAVDLQSKKKTRKFKRVVTALRAGALALAVWKLVWSWGQHASVL
jgi:hypothetical protein